MHVMRMSRDFASPANCSAFAFQFFSCGPHWPSANRIHEIEPKPFCFAQSSTSTRASVKNPIRIFALVEFYSCREASDLEAPSVQAPSSSETSNLKLQNLSSRSGRVWSLNIGASLDLGAWDLELSIPSSP